MKNLFARSNLIAGIIFVILAFLQLFATGSALGLLWIAGYVVIAVALFTGKRDILLAAGCGIVTLMALLNIFDTLGYSGMFTFINFVNFAALAALALTALAGTTNYVDSFKDTIMKLWFLPAVLRLVALILQLSLYSDYRMGFVFTLFMIIGGLLATAGFLFAAVWALFADRLPQVEKSERDAAAEANGYIGMVKHILLMVFTFGIWLLIWNYRTTKYLNRVDDEAPRKPVTELLLFMFIPFYGIFWNYKSVLRIDKLLQKNDLGPAITNVCLFWSVFVPVMAPVLMQESINRISLAETPAPEPEIMVLSEIREVPAQPERIDTPAEEATVEV